ncbi:hypothetical protein ACFQDE_20815 [Deinococcus caeni]|uniref:hypothetical protein n=1 Tax=Deinococcus caeni TaxID=569127 RepID=UPI0036138949
MIRVGGRGVRGGVGRGVSRVTVRGVTARRTASRYVVGSPVVGSYVVGSPVIGHVVGRMIGLELGGAACRGRLLERGLAHDGLTDGGRGQAQAARAGAAGQVHQGRDERQQDQHAPLHGTDREGKGARRAGGNVLRSVRQRAARPSGAVQVRAWGGRSSVDYRPVGP